MQLKPLILFFFACLLANQTMAFQAPEGALAVAQDTFPANHPEFIRIRHSLKINGKLEETFLTNFPNIITLELPDNYQNEPLEIKTIGLDPELTRVNARTYIIKVQQPGILSLGVLLHDQLVCARSVNVISRMPEGAPQDGDAPGSSGGGNIQPLGHVSVETPYGMAAFVGINNPVYITTEPVPENEKIIQFDGQGRFTAQGNTYLLQADQPGIANIEVIQQLDDSTKISLLKQPLMVQYLPNPDILLGGAKAGKLEKKALKNAETIELTFPFIREKVPAELLSFHLYVIPKGQEAQVFKFKGAQLDKEAMKALKELKGEEDIIMIDEIKVKVPGDPKIRQLKSAVFKVIS